MTAWQHDDTNLAATAPAMGEALGRVIDFWTQTFGIQVDMSVYAAVRAAYLKAGGDPKRLVPKWKPDDRRPAHG